MSSAHDFVWGSGSIFARDLSRIRLAAHAPVDRVEVEHTPLGVSRARRELLRRRRNAVASDRNLRQEFVSHNDED